MFMAQWMRRNAEKDHNLYVCLTSPTLTGKERFVLELVNESISQRLDSCDATGFFQNRVR